jgi:hypothetical protein
MDISRAKLNQKVIGKHFEGVGKIIFFKLSESGINRVYVDIELEDGRLISTPLDMVIPYGECSD